MALVHHCIGKIPTDLKLGIVGFDSTDQYQSNFLEQIEGFKMTFYESELLATHDLRRCRINGIIKISEHFTDSLLNSRYSVRPFDKVEVTLDSSEYVLYNFAKYKIITGFSNFTANVSKSHKISNFLKLKPLKVNTIFAPVTFELSINQIALATALLSISLSKSPKK
jgi:hypothetical protein